MIRSLSFRSRRAAASTRASAPPAAEPVRVARAPARPLFARLADGRLPVARADAEPARADPERAVAERAPLPRWPCDLVLREPPDFEPPPPLACGIVSSFSGSCDGRTLQRGGPSVWPTAALRSRSAGGSRRRRHVLGGPLGPQAGEEDRHDAAVELRSRVSLEFRDRLPNRERGAVDPLGGHRLERVRHREDLRLERDLLVA